MYAASSFPAFTFSPVRSPSSFSTFTTPQPTFTQRCTTPSFFTGPGTPTPIPCTSSLEIPFSVSFPSIACATSGRIDAPPLSLFVLISHLSMSLPSVSKNPILQVVPPTSTPNAYFFMLPFSCSLFVSLHRFLSVMYSADAFTHAYDNVSSLICQC